MRNGSAFWAIILIGGGCLLLLDNFGLFSALRFGIWNLVWPLFLVLLGIWLISRVLRPPALAQAEHMSVPLDGASRAAVELSHGAGQLSLSAGAVSELLMEGDFGGGLRCAARRRGESLDLEMKMRAEPVAFLNWSPGSFDWNVWLNPGVPLSLKCETGASESVLDLHDLQVTELKLETGASKTRVTLPAAAGFTRVKVEAGAARVDLRIPGGVAGRIRASAGLSSVTVDETRFPGFDNRYQSPDYETAANKVDIDIETGVGSVSVS
jgi:hypothetical protein